MYRTILCIKVKAAFQTLEGLQLYLPNKNNFFIDVDVSTELLRQMYAGYYGLPRRCVPVRELFKPDVEAGTDSVDDGLRVGHA